MHLLLAAFFSLAQVLSYPQPMGMTSAHDGRSIAYVLDERGVRSLWFASAPDFAPRKLWDSGTDDGQELTNLNISDDGKYVVYVRGGSHDANWMERPWPDSDLSPVQPHLAVMSIPIAGGTPKMLADGDAPVISPDSTTVAFLHDPDQSVWTASIDGSRDASRLFFDLVSDADLAYSPDGKEFAFTSKRGDHSFIGIYRNQGTPLQFLAPTTNRDSGAVWSPDGSQVAFLRIPGAGGPPRDLVKRQARPWSIWVAEVASGRAHEIWHSGGGLRDSVPGINGPQLNWLAGNNLMFISEQTNWPNIYEMNTPGGRARDITPGSFMVEDTAISPDRSTIFYTANTGNASGDVARRHIFRVSASGGRPQQVTSGTDSQWWPQAVNGGVAYVNAGSREPFTIAFNGHKLNSDQIPADFPTASLVVPKLVSFKSTDGLTIQGTLFVPNGYSGKRPAVIFVHGGPPRQMMTNWHYFDYYSFGYGSNQYLANRGVVVLSVNYRLGIGYGHDFQYPAHAGPAGASEYNDIVAAAKYVQHLPDVDSKRIGIYGGSYGGYLTAMALAKNSDIFKVGADQHGVHDWSDFPEWYDAGNLHRYQQPDVKTFLKTAWLSSPDAYISTWRSPVLLIQGDDDRNVRFHQTVDLAERLRLAHVYYEELVIPNEIHGFLRWQSWLDADTAADAFLMRYLKP